MPKKKKGSISVTRRDFLKNTCATGAALGVAALAPGLARKAFAAKRDHILIGLPNPATGPLADFGIGSPWTNERVISAVNKAGGIYIKEYGKKVPVKLRIMDTQSNPNKAAELASRLILHDKVDLMVAMHTPDTVNPVSAICERYEMPCVATDNPVEAWLTGGPYKWSYNAFWTLDTWTDIYVDLWDQSAGKTNKVVAALLPNDADGTEIAKIFIKKLPARGYKLIDPGRFPFFNKDYSSMINLFKKEKADILTGCLITPDWATAWRQCHQQGFVPKIVTMGKAILFPSAVNALGGNLPNGLSMETWWTPNHPFKSALTGETARSLGDAWVKETGKQWTQPIGYKHAGFEIALDAIKRAGTLEKNKLREAIEKTDLDTVVGHIKFNEKHYAPTPLVGGQWVKGKKWPWEVNIINNQRYPEVKKTAEMIFPLPQ
jgi:branched-chain amino acid transport system substrate-binding protein